MTEDTNAELTPAAPATAAPAEAERPLAPAAKPDVGGFYWGTGRRKSAVARVRLRPAKDQGNPQYMINGKPVTEYFTELRDQADVVFPLKCTQTEGNFDIYVNATGGGYTGQAGAVVLGLARAIKGYDPSLEPILREHDLLTRDPRRVERKKYGQPGARKRFQFSKR